MGTIVARKRKDGTTGFTAQIVIKKDGKAVHREARTFDRRQAAAAWLEARERALRKPGGVEAANLNDPTLAHTIQRYTEETKREIGRTKAQVLKALKAMPIAEKRCSTIRSSDIVELAATLVVGRQPQTVGNYLSHLGSIFAIAKPAWGYPLNPDAMTDAATVAKRLGYISKSRERDRRPTLDELNRLLAHFVDQNTRRISARSIAFVIRAGSGAPAAAVCPTPIVQMPTLSL